MARWLGIDVQDDVVRVALLRSGLGRPHVEALREERIASHESAEAALRAVSLGLRPDSVAIAIDGSRAFLRRLQLPVAVQRELGRVLTFEVESTLPFELEGAVLDHRVLRGTVDVGGKRQLRILAGVALEAPIRERIELCRGATGVEPERVGIGVLPLANLAQLAAELRRPEVIALVHVEAQHTDVLLMAGGEPLQVRTISRGSSSLPDAALPWARDLRQTLTAWRLEGGTAPVRLHVVGVGTSIPGLDGYLATELDVPATELPALALDGLGPDGLSRTATFAKAIALAASLSRRAVDLNLRRGALEAQQSYRFLREQTPILAGLASALVVSFGFYVYAQLSGLGAEHDALQEQLAGATRAVFGEETRDPDHASELLDRALAGKSDDPLPEIDAFGVMTELARRTPKEVTHDVAEFDYNRGAVVIRGLVDSIDDAQLVSTKMDEHPCFRDLKISRTTKLAQENKQKYQLEFSVKCGGPAKKAAAPGAAASASAGAASSVPPASGSAPPTLPTPPTKPTGPAPPAPTRGAPTAGGLP